MISRPCDHHSRGINVPNKLSSTCNHFLLIFVSFHIFLFLNWTSTFHILTGFSVFVAFHLNFSHVLTNRSAIWCVCCAQGLVRVANDVWRHVENFEFKIFRRWFTRSTSLKANLGGVMLLFNGARGNTEIWLCSAAGKRKIRSNRLKILFSAIGSVWRQKLQL